jgi:hypothetical protein
MHTRIDVNVVPCFCSMKDVSSRIPIAAEYGVGPWERCRGLDKYS